MERDSAPVDERVPCPICLAPAGEPCVRLPGGYVLLRVAFNGVSSASVVPMGAVLKHSHAERLRAEEIPDR